MSTSKNASTSRSSRVTRSKNVVGVSQASTQTVDDYKHEFFEKVESLQLGEDEVLLAKWFRDGLCEAIKAQIPKTTTKSTMEEILGEAYLVETRLETIPPEEWVDKHMVSEDTKTKDDEVKTDEDPEEDPEENNDDDNDSLHGDYHHDSRYWVYDDLDQWGQGDDLED